MDLNGVWVVSHQILPHWILNSKGRQVRNLPYNLAPIGRDSRRSPEGGIPPGCEITWQRQVTPYGDALQETCATTPLI
jgi:hypothetical protein